MNLETDLGRRVCDSLRSQIDHSVGASDQEGWFRRTDGLGGDHAFTHVAARGNLVHDVQEDLFDDGPQPAGTRFQLKGTLGGGLEGVVFELKLDFVKL